MMSKVELFSRRNVSSMIKDKAYFSLPNPKGKFLDYYIFGIVHDPYLDRFADKSVPDPSDKKLFLTFLESGKMIAVNYIGKVFDFNKLKHFSFSAAEIQRAYDDYVLYFNRQTEILFDLHKTIVPDRAIVRGGEADANPLDAGRALHNMILKTIPCDDQKLREDIETLYLKETNSDDDSIKIELNWKIIGSWFGANLLSLCLKYLFPENDWFLMVLLLFTMGSAFGSLHIMAYSTQRATFRSDKFKAYLSEYTNLCRSTEKWLKAAALAKDCPIGSDTVAGEPDFPSLKLLKSPEPAAREPLRTFCQDKERIFARRVLYTMVENDGIAVDLFLPDRKHIPNSRAVLSAQGQISRKKLDSYSQYENYAYFVHSVALCAADFFLQRFSSCNRVVLSAFVGGSKPSKPSKSSMSSKRLKRPKSPKHRIYEVEFDRKMFYELDFEAVDPVYVFERFPHKRKLTPNFRFEPV